MGINGINARHMPVWPGWDTTPTTPIVADVPSVQTTLPTSAYGQTIPVVWFKARLPGAYIWVPPIVTVTTTQQESGATTVKSKMSARLRFARPLVPDSTWTLRKFYANGKLIYDATTGYRQSGLKFKAYDGRSTQLRDPTMVAEEGATNVSAHRGYLDIVVTDFDIAGLGAPPTFEAEWLQAAPSVDVDNFTILLPGALETVAAPDWDTGTFYAIDADFYIRRFHIDGLREIYAVPITGAAFNSIETGSLRYIPALNCLFAFGAPIFTTVYGILIDAETGVIVAEDTSGVERYIECSALCQFGSTSIFVGHGDLGAHYIYRIAERSVTQTFFASGWGGYSDVTCLTFGTVRSIDADLWVCADDKLVKSIVTSAGILAGTTEFATFSANLVYALWHDGDVIVFTDDAHVIRIDGITAATVWTKTVPYQITASLVNPATAPDLNRLDGVFMFQESDAYNFTDLDTGLTTSVSKTSGDVNKVVYDGQANLAITTSQFLARPFRTLFNASGDGTKGELSDFLVALFEASDYESAEIDTVNIDDLIDGAVIDVTAGVRDIARSVAEPYSFAIFERSGQIILKRAATDADFAVDVTVSSAGDIADSGGQAIKAKRFNPEEFISRYGINYRDPDEIYQSRPQYGEIPTLPFPVAPADQSVKGDMPIIVDGDAVKQLATQRVNRLALERHEFRKTLRAKFGDIEPEDIERFSFANRTITARVKEMTLRPDFMVDVVATEFLTSVSISISGATGRPTEPNPVGTPESRYYHLDIPLKADGDDIGGSGFVQYHVLASSGQPYWDGATLFRKDAAGLYQTVAGQVTNGLVGIALEALPDWDIPYVTEFTRTLNLVIISGNTDLLTSATYLEMMNGTNFFAIGQPGRWEVCQVMAITLNGNGSYTFEGLRRGRMSSEEYTGLHQTGDFVVWLSEDNVQRIDYSIASLNDAFDFKPVGFGGSISTTLSVNRTVTGEAEKIPKPCQLDASIDSPSDVRLSWVRRSRIGSFWADDGEDTYTAPLGESLEQYVVRIKNGPGGTVLRTVTVNDATVYDYSGALQTTDFGSPLTSGSSLTFDVRQVSATGVICPTREATITL